MPATSKIITEDLGWERMKRDLSKLNVNIESGLFGSGSPKDNVAARGAVHQNGSKKRNIPRRPFMSMAADSGKNKLLKFIEKQYMLLMAGKINDKTFSDRVGVFHADQIKAMIRGGSFDALKPKTIKRKKSSKPLIDKAIMKNSVTHKVRKRA